MLDLRSQEWDATVPRMGLPQANPLMPLRKQQEAAADERRIEAVQQREHEMVLRGAMQHRDARTLVRLILGYGQPAGQSPCPTHSTFNTNAMEMARGEGRREVKCWLWNELERHCPDQLALLLKEAKEP